MGKLKVKKKRWAAMNPVERINELHTRNIGLDHLFDDSPPYREEDVPHAEGSMNAKATAKPPIHKHLHYGDNLEVMKTMPEKFADLTYLDPPFKSDIDYNLLFTEDGISPDEAQMTAFKDTWTWDQAAQAAYEDLSRRSRNQ